MRQFLVKRRGWMSFYAFMIILVLSFYLAGTQMSAVDQSLAYRFDIFSAQSRQAADSALAIALKGTVSHCGSWVNMAVPPPAVPRADYTAIWTGSKMIVWGGVNAAGDKTKTAGIYDPLANSWTVATLAGAPAERKNHTAVWTGSEMLIWGGESLVAPVGSYLKNGGKYNPTTNTWAPITLAGAPIARIDHTAVWTGSEMLIWGGLSSSPNQPVNTGSRYNPTTDSWASISGLNAPARRHNHTATWDGNLMVVWGGTGWAPPQPLNTGARYDPGSDSWSSMNYTNVPAGRTHHTAVFNGTETIVWGGLGFAPSEPLDDGGIYNASTNLWRPISGSGVARQKHSAVWMDQVMTVWGGEPDMTGVATNSGDAFRPEYDCWGLVTQNLAPVARKDYSAVWADNEMIIWGGRDNSGALLDDGKRWQPPARIPVVNYEMQMNSSQIATITFEYELSSYTPAIVLATATVSDRNGKETAVKLIKNCLDVERHEFCPGTWTN
jgi:hypothetical protein